MTRRGLGLGLVSLLVALWALVPSTASAVTIGSLDLPAGATGQICALSPCTVVQRQLSPTTQLTYTLRSPITGTLTGWSFRNGNVEAINVFALRVLRPTNQAETDFKVVGSVDAPALPDSDDKVRGPFPANIPVQAGDRIALESKGPFEFGVPVLTTGQNDPDTGDGLSFISPPPADGDSITPISTGNTGQIVLVQAQIDEPAPPPPPPPPPPDFKLVLQSGSSQFTLPRSGSLTIPLAIDRSDNSRGPIKIDVSGLPPGLTASVQAPQVDVNGLVADPVTITQGPGAPPKPGIYTLEIDGTPLNPSAGARPRSLDLDLVVRGQLRVHVQGLEVSQAVQPLAQPTDHVYSGVPLVTRKKTVAKVFVGLSGADGERPSGGILRPPLGMTLAAYDSHGAQLPFSPLLPEWSPPVDSLKVSTDPDRLSTADRVADDSAYTFVLPDTWTKRGPLRLVAQAVSSNLPFGNAGSEICTFPSCGAQPTWVLSDVSFRRNPPPRDINALAQPLYDPKTNLIISTPGPPGPVFTKLMALSPVPFRFMTIMGTPTTTPWYRAVEDAPDGRILEAAQKYDADIGHEGSGTFGAFANSAGNGVTVGRVSVGTVNIGSAGDVDRPVTVVAHELFHQLGFGHADTVCGGGGDQRPDSSGHMLSVGLDTSGAPPYRVIRAVNGVEPFDLMSYCPGQYGNGDPLHWISAFNWNRIVNSLPAATSARAASKPVVHVAAAGDSLTVRARADAGGVQIVSVGKSADAVAASPAGSPYVLVGRSRRGDVESSVPMRAESALDASPPFSTLEGQLSGAGIARVEIVSGGAVVATRDRSVNAPTAKILSPGGGAKVGKKGKITVRWDASDQNRDALDIALDYSSDGGRTFNQVFAGPDVGHVDLPTKMLPGSAKARFRLRVNDGFTESVAVSKRFVVVARPPSVTITQPSTGAALAGGSTVFLSGGAIDCPGNVLAGRQLRWMADGATLGYGEQLTAKLPAGTRRIRLVATDSAHRVGSASIRVKAPSSRAFFLRLEPPRKLSHKAHQAALVVAATQDAVLKVGGKQFRVGVKARRVRVPVRPGRGPLTLQLRLVSGGKSTPQTLTIQRG